MCCGISTNNHYNLKLVVCHHQIRGTEPSSYKVIIFKLTSVPEAKIVLNYSFVKILFRTLCDRKMALCSTCSKKVT